MRKRTNGLWDRGGSLRSRLWASLVAALKWVVRGALTGAVIGGLVAWIMFGPYAKLQQGVTRDVIDFMLPTFAFIGFVVGAGWGLIHSLMLSLMKVHALRCSAKRFS